MIQIQRGSHFFCRGTCEGLDTPVRAETNPRGLDRPFIFVVLCTTIVNIFFVHDACFQPRITFEAIKDWTCYTLVNNWMPHPKQLASGQREVETEVGGGVRTGDGRSSGEQGAGGLYFSLSSCPNAQIGLIIRATLFAAQEKAPVLHLKRKEQR